MLSFKSPSTRFLAEMVEHNVQHNRSSLDLSVVPRSILEKIVHAVAMRSLTGSQVPRVDISVGPDEDYHHAVHGIAAISSDTANVFYQVEEDWYSVCLTSNSPDDHDIFVLRLVDDAEDRWDELELEIVEEAVLARALVKDAMNYLGIAEQHAAAA